MSMRLSLSGYTETEAFSYNSIVHGIERKTCTAADP